MPSLPLRPRRQLRWSVPRLCLGPASRIQRVVLAAALACLVATPTLGWSRDTQVLELTGNDTRQNQAQRELADRLARRHIGPRLRQDESDLRILQQLLDGSHVDMDQPFEVQALGVALGDVMVERLGLHWVILLDEVGRSRALRYKETDEFFFPVTMFSRRMGGGVRPDVRALYRKVADRVAELRESESRRRARPRPKLTLPTLDEDSD